MASIVIGLLCLALIILSVGSASALLLYSLDQATLFFHSHDSMILALPVLGLATGLTYWHFGKKVPNTQNILYQTHEREAILPFTTAIFIFAFTILSQLFGASTGRESTAVQFGASFGHFWKTVFERFRWPLRFHRQAFIRAGLAAGFGAVFGVPWAGTLFALEVTPQRRWQFRYLPLCWIASFGAHWMALWWGAHHKIYPTLQAQPWDVLLILKWLCLGLIFGVTAKLFVVLLQNLERRFFRRFFFPWLAPAIGGLCVAALTLLIGSTRYNGLGTQLIEAAFLPAVQNLDFLWKSIFTLLSSGSGLKGGEVTPLMAIGATLGAVVSSWIAVPATYAASMGLVSVFAASAHIPWTGAIMAWELFGFEAFLPAFIVCWIAGRVTGFHGLFSAKD